MSRVDKTVKFFIESLFTNFRFLVLVGLISTGLLLSFASLRPLMRNFLLLNFPPDEGLTYLLGYPIITIALTTYFYFSNFADKEDIGKSLGHSVVVSILLVSSVRFSGYFTPEEIYKDFIQFFTSLIILSPVSILVFVFRSNLRKEDKISMLSNLGTIANNKTKIAKNASVLFIGGLASFLVEKYLITKMESWHLYTITLIFLISLCIVSEIFNLFGEDKIRDLREEFEEMNSKLNQDNPRS